jgi:hypothetical protein
MTLSVPKHSRARLAAARQDVIRMSRVIPLAGDDMRFTELTQVLRGLSEQLGLETDRGALRAGCRCRCDGPVGSVAPLGTAGISLMGRHGRKAPLRSLVISQPWMAHAPPIYAPTFEFRSPRILTGIAESVGGVRRLLDL